MLIFKQITLHSRFDLLYCRNKTIKSPDQLYYKPYNKQNSMTLHEFIEELKRIDNLQNKHTHVE